MQLVVTCVTFEFPETDNLLKMIMHAKALFMNGEPKNFYLLILQLLTISTFLFIVDAQSRKSSASVSLSGLAALA